MTWPEIKEVIKEERVAIVPVAIIEEHGYHLPVDTDLVLTWEICVRTGRKIPGDMVLIPPVNHGYAPHQMDFPGVISISGETFTNYVTDILRSLAHQGFKKILLVNGHGSNISFLRTAARKAILEYPEVMCAAISYWDLQPVIETAAVLRESENPGGMNHACELETSMYLAIRADLVRMDKAVRDLDRFSTSKYFWLDLVGQGEGRPVLMIPYWSSISETGTLGDPTTATKEKGERLLDASVCGLMEFINIFKARRHHPRVNHLP